MATANKMVTLTTLRGYARTRENVVLFWHGRNAATGTRTLMGHPEFTFAEHSELLDLAGEIGEKGDWHWIGPVEEGLDAWPNDPWGGAIYNLYAYVDALAWARMANESY